MKIPILRLRNILLTSLQVDLTDDDIVDFQEELLKMTSEINAAGAVIDITAMDVVDSFMARVLNDTATMVHLLGTPVAATYRLPGGEELLAVNVHMLAFETNKMPGYVRQLEQMEEYMSAHDGPILLAGDFNTWGTKRLDLVLAFAERLDLTEVEEFHGSMDRSAANPGLKSVVDKDKLDLDLPLDRVFLRGLRPLDAYVISQESSDHLPFLVEVEAP